MMGRERSELSYSVVHVHDVGKFTLYGAVDMQLHLKLSNPRDAVLVHLAVASAHVLTVSALLCRQPGTCSLTSQEEFIGSLFINLFAFSVVTEGGKKQDRVLKGRNRDLWD